MMRKRRVVVVEHRYTVADVLSRTLEPILDCGSKVRCGQHVLTLTQCDVIHLNKCVLVNHILIVFFLLLLF